MAPPRTEDAMLNHLLRPLMALAVALPIAAVAADPQLEPPALEQRAEAAARSLASVETADGRFLYEFDFLRSRFVSDDNVVRQAGAGFILNHFLFASGNPNAREPAARAIGYFAAQSVKHGAGALVSADRTLDGALAGGTALALLAELFHTKATGTDFRRDLRELWLAGLAAQQLPSGGIAQRTGDTDEDSYATGETWLALAHYAELEPDAPGLTPLLETLEARVMEKYLATPDNQFAHWGLMSAAQRLNHTGEQRYRDFIIAFARPYVESRFDPATAADREGSNTCAALEGLAAAASALTRAGETEVSAVLRQTLDRELPPNMLLQLPAGETRRAYGPDRFYEDPKLANFAGAFLNNAYALRTRLDFTQHCLSAILLYRELITGQVQWGKL
jgi:hypothetical protein